MTMTIHYDSSLCLLTFGSSSEKSYRDNFLRRLDPVLYHVTEQRSPAFPFSPFLSIMSRLTLRMQTPPLPPSPTAEAFLQNTLTAYVCSWAWSCVYALFCFIQVCDMQGVDRHITDPAIHSKLRQYGDGDRGSKGKTLKGGLASDI